MSGLLGFRALSMGEEGEVGLSGGASWVAGSREVVANSADRGVPGRAVSAVLVLVVVVVDEAGGWIERVRSSGGGIGFLLGGLSADRAPSWWGCSGVESARSIGQGDWLEEIERERMRVRWLESEDWGGTMRAGTWRGGWWAGSSSRPRGWSRWFGASAGWSSWSGLTLCEEEEEEEEAEEAEEEEEVVEEMEGESERWRVRLRSWRREWESESALERLLRVGWSAWLPSGWPARRDWKWSWGGAAASWGLGGSSLKLVA